MVAEKIHSNTKSGEVGRRRGHPVRLAAAVAATALTAAACSNNKAPDASAGATPRPPAAESSAPNTAIPSALPPTLTAPPSAAACELKNGTRRAALRYDQGVHLSSLVGRAVSFGDHGCFERIVFRFAGSSTPNNWPGVLAHYVEAPVRAQPSGKLVDVPGKAFLEIDFGSWMYQQGDGEGPTRISSPSLEHVAGAVLTQNYQGITSWTVGLDRERDLVLGEVSSTPDCETMCLTVDIEG